MKVSSLFACVAVLGLVACGGEKPAAKPPAAKPADAAPATQAAAPAAAVSEFGVPECDEYMTKYLACIDSKVPEAARASVRQGLEQSKAAWKQAAATPEGKAGLATGCKQALEGAKMAMQAYGCSW